MTASATEPGPCGTPAATPDVVAAPPPRAGCAGGENTLALEDQRIAWLAAVAVALSLTETALPSPVPGIKPGIANIVTLIVLTRHGWAAAAWVSLLRVLTVSLLLGSFLTPGFILGASGAVASLAALGAARWLPERWFGPVTASVASAVAHMGAQWAVFSLWLSPGLSIAWMLPVFAGAALVFGGVNGWIAGRLLRPRRRQQAANDCPLGAVYPP